MNERLRDEILVAHAADQALRARMTASISRAAVSADVPESWAELVQQAERLDQEHSLKVGKWLREHGWVGVSLVGGEAALAFAHLVGHRVSADVVEEAIPFLRAAVEAGEAPPATLAEVEDRSCVARGVPQRYGTQWRQVDAGPYEPHPLEGSVEEVDQRRGSVGLPSLEEFRAQLIAAYGESGDSTSVP